MMKVKVCYFSPTGTTLQVAGRLARELGHRLGAEVEYCPYTLPSERQSLPVLAKEDVVLWATPVYAGRIPNKTLDFVRAALLRDGERANNYSVALVTFGNRAYDNALAELVGLMQEGGMQPVGGAAVVTRHAFSDTLGAGRPHAGELEALDSFAAQVADAIKGGRHAMLQVPGEAHPEKYYTPLKTNSAPAGFLKARPSCDEALCSHCGRCVERCPMGSIRMKEGIPQFEGVCIKCQACRRGCPEGAISFADPDYQSHVAMIERTFADPKRSEFFV